jgi:hypothetical protein
MKNKYVSYAIWLLTLVAGVVWLPTVWYGAIDWRELELQYIPLCVAVLYYYSFIRLKAIYCKPLFESFLQKKPPKTFFSNLAFLFTHWSFWVASAALVLPFLALPIALTHPQLAELCFDIFQKIEKLKILAVFLPVLLLINLLAHLSCVALWQAEAKWRKYENKNTKAARFIYTMAIYTFAPLLIVALLPMLAYIPLIFKALWIFMTPATFVLLILLVLTLTFFTPLRAYSIRKKAVKQIKESCAQMGYTLSDIREPYRSIFKPCEGESFSITKGDKTYSCKFIAAPKRALPMAIHPNGEMHFFHALVIRKVKLLSYKTVKHFGYDSPNPKILIVNPVPKKLMAYQGTIVEIDNGHLVGDYKVYNITAFIRAIENDILDR